jgi:hypothetical protein
MVARLSFIFGDGTKNFLDGDLLAATLRSNREVYIFIFRMARQSFSCVQPAAHTPDEIDGSASAFYANRTDRRPPVVTCSA